MVSTQLIIILLFGIAGLFMMQTRQNVRIQKWLFVSIVMLFIIVAAGRSETMADYSDYILFFENKGYTRFELGFRLIRSIVQMSNTPTIIGIVIVAFISISIRLFYVYKYSPWFWGSILVYITYVYILHDMITIRAGVASALFPFMILFREKNEYVKMFAMLILATLFHQSAAIFAIIFFMDKDKPRRLIYIFALVASYILAINGYQFGRLIAYVTVNSVSNLFSDFEGSQANIFNLMQMGHVAICLTGWLFIDKIRNIDKRAVLMLKSYTVGLCLVPLLSDYLVIAYRFCEILISVEIILIPIIFSSFSRKSAQSKLLLLIYSLVMFYLAITNEGWWNPKGAIL